MQDAPSPFSAADDELFDPPDAYVPENLPAAGEFLEDHDVLEGDDHVAVHRTAAELFEERGVYDMTFGYNLAQLNLDRRHPDAGFRYAEDADDPSVLWAAFTPTTPFCPQAHTLAQGAFRAWNGLVDRHDYDLVRVRVAGMHHASDDTNDQLAGMEERFLETGSVAAPADEPGPIQPGRPDGPGGD
ncbi:MAG: hypothetical protein ABEJ92_02070 [Halobacteriales archaeon]